MGVEDVVNGFSKLLDERTKPGSIPATVTLSDTVELTITDPETNDTKFCRAFHVNATGTLTCRFGQASSDSILEVTKGLTYPYSVKLFKSTGTTIGNGDIIAIR